MGHGLKNSFRVKTPLKNVHYSLCAQFLPMEITYEQVCICPTASSITRLSSHNGVFEEDCGRELPKRTRCSETETCPMPALSLTQGPTRKLILAAAHD